MQQLELTDVQEWRGNKILVEALDAEEKKGSLYLPAAKNDGEDNKTWRARVVDYGTEADRDELKRNDVIPGAIIHVRPISYNCPSFTYNGKRHTLISASLDDMGDILAVEA